MSDEIEEVSGELLPELDGEELDIIADDFESELSELQQLVDQGLANSKLIGVDVLPKLLAKAATITNPRQLEMITSMITAFSSLQSATRGNIDSKMKAKSLRFNQRLRLRPDTGQGSVLSANDIKTITDLIKYTPNASITISQTITPTQQVDDFESLVSDLVDEGKITGLELMGSETIK